MHGITGEKDTAASVALGHEAAPVPDIHAEPLDRIYAPERAMENALAINPLRRQVSIGAINHQPPEAAPRIDDAQVAPEPLPVNHQIERREPTAAIFQQSRRAEKHVDRIADGALPEHADAERFAHLARRTVTAHQIIGLQNLLRPTLEIRVSDRNAALVLLKLIKTGAIPEHHRRIG